MLEIKKDYRSRVVSAWETYLTAVSIDDIKSAMTARWDSEQHDEFPKYLSPVYPDITFSEHLEIFLLSTLN